MMGLIQTSLAVIGSVRSQHLIPSARNCGFSSVYVGKQKNFLNRNRTGRQSYENAVSPGTFIIFISSTANYFLSGKAGWEQ